MDRGEVWCEDVDWVCLARDGDKLRALVKTIVNFSASWSSVSYAKL
jgi:hypothetical protein